MNEVLLELRDGIAIATLNRPQLLNAIDPGLLDGLQAALERAEAEDVTALVLTGAGRGFSAGGDLRAVGGLLAAGGDIQVVFGDVVGRLHGTIRRLRALPKPVIAAVNGVTSGAGVSLAAACDLRIAAASATFKAAYTAIGLTPDAGWTALVPALVGHARATELLLLEQKIEAARALAIGLVNEVTADEELLPRALAVATAAGAHPAGAWAGAKALLNAALVPLLDAALEREQHAVAARAASPQFLSRLRQFLAG